MSILSVSSFLQPLNGLGSAKPANNAEETRTATSSNAAFILDLSDKAQEIIAADKGVSVTDRTKTLDERVKEQSEAVQNKMTRLLLSRNIDFSKNMDFEIDSSGNIRIKGDVDNKEAIENVLNGDSSFRNELKQLLSDASDLATQKIKEKYKIALKALEKDDDEDKEKKKLELQNKYIQMVQNVGSISGNFSLNNGSLNIASLDFAAGVGF